MAAIDSVTNRNEPLSCMSFTVISYTIHGNFHTVQTGVTARATTYFSRMSLSGGNGLLSEIGADEPRSASEA